MANKGEGSRGGKIVGHYSSGRAKYDSIHRRIITGASKAVIGGAKLAYRGTKAVAHQLHEQSYLTDSIQLGAAGLLSARASHIGKFKRLLTAAPIMKVGSVYFAAKAIQGALED